MCLGKGTVPSERCPTCGGSGEVRSKKKVMIIVPEGVDSGTKIRLKGQGARGNRNGPPGDLLITFQVEPDRFFRREGLDVVAPVPINIAQATLGSKVQVRTIDVLTVEKGRVSAIWVVADDLGLLIQWDAVALTGEP